MDIIDEDFLTCSICFERYKKPQILPCLHTFCSVCLVTLAEKRGGSLNRCPTCNAECESDQLKDNFFLSNLVEEFSKQSLTSGETPLQCESCEDKTAFHHCLDCSQHFCADCLKVHGKMAVSRCHQVVTIEDYKKNKSTNLCKPEVMIHCQYHVRSELKFQCETCQEVICSDCAVIKHRGTEHVLRDLKEVGNEQRKCLENMVTDMKRAREQLEDKIIKLCVKRDELNLHAKKEEKNISSQAKELIEQITMEEKVMIEKSKKQHDIRIKNNDMNIEELESIKSRLFNAHSYVETLMHHGNDVQLLRTMKETTNHLEQLINQEPEAIEVEAVIEFMPKTYNSGIIGEFGTDVHVCIS
uniref:Transcription intermediary factor 1-alpha-like n=1 Tax=Saccoglossus kowalevskii TaxID=10224 RepID=A0ABM0MLY1_SACKO|nr:PREDICTED: transcription intermediary factor 1-alpha-like [Saccoglossus kowalevskii]